MRQASSSAFVPASLLRDDIMMRSREWTLVGSAGGRGDCHSSYYINRVRELADSLRLWFDELDLWHRNKRSFALLLTGFSSCERSAHIIDFERSFNYKV
jgi:hypothetical protein